MPVFDRLAPPPPRELLADRIESLTAPGDVVLDLCGRGGWVARAAIDRQRRAVSLESGPLSRLLAEIVLRPPTADHLDAAFEALAASPHGASSLRQAVGELFATRCPACGRPAVADEIVWQTTDGASRPIRKRSSCAACRESRAGRGVREGRPDAADEALARELPEAGRVRLALRSRFPAPDGDEAIVDDLLGLHSDRQLVGLAWILERIEGEVRAEPIEAALRLAFLHAVLPSSRLAGAGSRVAALKMAAGRLRPAKAGTWRERNPWLAFEDGHRAIRSLVLSLGSAPDGPVQARFGNDLRSLAHGPTTAVVKVTGPATLQGLADEARDLAAGEGQPPVRLAIGQLPLLPTGSSAAITFHATAWALGTEAAAALRLESLQGPATGPPITTQMAALREILEAAETLIARDGRAILLVEGGGEALVAVALAGAAAGYRLIDARPGWTDGTGLIELAPPGASLPPGPRTRANVPLAAVPGGAGDPEMVPGRGLFAPPERVDARPFSASDAARIVADTAVDLLTRRGEPAPFELLLAAILVELDRAGELRRLAATAQSGTPGSQDGADSPDLVEQLLALIRGALSRPTRPRVAEVEPGHWWLADREDLESAATPLADRVEWAAYSLLSTARSMSEAEFVARMRALFGGHDLPADGIVEASLASYRNGSGDDDRIVTAEDLARRTAEQAELLAALVDGGHRLGMEVWLAPREQEQLVGGLALGELLSDRERNVHLPFVARGRVEELAAVDCIWYVRGRIAMLFEVDWTAILGHTVLRRHGQIPVDDRVVRFLVVPPERSELLGHKIDGSAPLRTAFQEANWHVLKWNHLRSFLALEPLSLDALEPFVGLDPLAERPGQQMPLFRAGRYP